MDWSNFDLIHFSFVFIFSFFPLLFLFVAFNIYSITFSPHAKPINERDKINEIEKEFPNEKKVKLFDCKWVVSLKKDVERNPIVLIVTVTLCFYPIFFFFFNRTFSRGKKQQQSDHRQFIFGAAKNEWNGLLWRPLAGHQIIDFVTEPVDEMKLNWSFRVSLCAYFTTNEIFSMRCVGLERSCIEVLFAEWILKLTQKLFP